MLKSIAIYLIVITIVNLQVNGRVIHKRYAPDEPNDPPSEYTRNDGHKFFSDVMKMFSSNRDEQEYGRSPFDFFGKDRPAVELLPEEETTESPMATKMVEQMTEQVQRIFDSLSKMWSHTVDKQMESYGKMLPNDTWDRINGGLEATATQIRGVQTRLDGLMQEYMNMSMSDLTESASEMFNQQIDQLDDAMKNTWSQINDGIREGTSNFFGFMDSQKRGNMKTTLINAQEEINNIWKEFSKKIPESYEVAESTLVPEVDTGLDPEVEKLIPKVPNTEEQEQELRNEVYRISNMQEHFEKIWQDVTRPMGSDQSPFGSIQDRIDAVLNDMKGDDEPVLDGFQGRFDSVWNNMRGFLSDKGDGDPLTGIFRTGGQFPQRVGNYFHTLWSRGSDALNSRLNDGYGRVRSMMNQINETLLSHLNKLNPPAEVPPTSLVPTSRVPPTSLVTSNSDSIAVVAKPDEIEREDP